MSVKPIAHSRQRCPACDTRMMRVDGKPQCSNWQCPASPIAAPREVLAPDRVRDARLAAAGYRPAQSPLPSPERADMLIGKRGGAARRAAPPSPASLEPAAESTREPSIWTVCSPDVLRDLILAGYR